MYSYKISYDLEIDIWNWFDAMNESFMGADWINSIDNDSDREIANRIKSLSKGKARTILKNHLTDQRNDPHSRINVFVKTAQIDFATKFKDACRALEEITGRPLYTRCFKIYVTTFPSMTYLYEKGAIIAYCSTQGFWGMPIDGFIHEALHLQFIHYWQKELASPVSKLDEEKFDYLKEALTVVLDDNLKSVLTMPDPGYPEQRNFRKVLHKHWARYHNFDKLVEYGLKKMPEFMD
jgi:hypothetical protein